MNILIIKLISWLGLAIIFIACSNSELTGPDNEYLTGKKSNTSSATDIFFNEYLPLNDTEYPYTGIPRIVIETESHQAIRSRETNVNAKLQIWGESTPESNVMELTIRGRGNTSWEEMPKKSYKIEFFNKQAILGMPQNKDWALIANYADKTLIKNFLAYELAQRINLGYTPKSRFIELFLNQEYLGVYQIVETIKQGNQRVNISSNGFLAEFDVKSRNNDLTFETISGKTIKVHYPKDSENVHNLKEHLDSLELFLEQEFPQKSDSIEKWLNLDIFAKHFWIQEFSKNPDAYYYTSVFFSWEPGNAIKIGPVWDFDLAFGGHEKSDYREPSNWRTIGSYWNKYLFKDSSFKSNVFNYWVHMKDEFLSSFEIIDSCYMKLKNPAINNFKRWDVLSDTSNRWHPYSFHSYEESLDSLKQWISNRIEWIDKQVLNFEAPSNRL